jgi:4'-phosphopantetheinyl transferase
MDVSEMYRIPWTKDDNPNGWVEVTTQCQLDCPGCYRGFDENQEASPAEKLLELKQDTDTLIRTRNIQTLSIAGGEPLLFPLLDELIGYVRAKGVAPRLFTNAVQLTEQRLRRLASAGCAEVIIHASLWQDRLRPNTLTELLKLKARHCELFRTVGNVRLGFIEPAMRSSLDDFDVLFDFYQKNADVVGNVVFTTFKDVYGGPTGEYVPVAEISEKIEKCYGTRPCAYIPKTYHPETIAWLLNVAVLRNGQVVGEIDKDEYETIQEMHRIATKLPRIRAFRESVRERALSRRRLSRYRRRHRQALNYQIVASSTRHSCSTTGASTCATAAPTPSCTGEWCPCILDRSERPPGGHSEMNEALGPTPSGSVVTTSASGTRSPISQPSRIAAKHCSQRATRNRVAGGSVSGGSGLFIVAHALLRTALSRCAAARPEEWRFSTAAHGRPEIDTPPTRPRLRFNLSHTRGLVACAVTLERDVGIDVEHIGRWADTVALARRYFSSPENRLLAGLPAPAARARFFSLWTLKESYVKARGLGLGIPLDVVSFQVVPGMPPAVSFGPGHDEDARAWQFALLEPRPGCRLAVAARREVGARIDFVLLPMLPAPDAGSRQLFVPAWEDAAEAS